MHGYCVPTTPAPQAAYHAAGVNISASELNALRTSLLHEDGRYFDAIFGDVVLVWPLLLGCPIVAAATAWIVVCFTAATLHTAAVPRDLIQATPEARMFFGLSPDRRWLQWVRGSTLHGPFGRPEHAFDEKADFIVRYATRRKQLEAQPELRVRR
jgi:hypothetical protein